MLDIMGRNDCHPNIMTFTSLLKGYFKAKRFLDGMKLFCETSERGLIANTVTYCILVQGFCQSGKLKIAEELFQEMVSRGVLPDIMTYGILLDGLCDNGKLEKALEIFEDLQKRLCKKGSLSEANILLEKMEKDGNTPNDCTYNTLIRAHLHAGDLAIS